VLERLADGRWYGPADLQPLAGDDAEQLQTELADIAGLGVVLRADPVRGWCIPGGLELLQRERVDAALADTSRPLLESLEILRVVDSSNAHLLRQTPPAPGRGRVCLADSQRAGRGRRGRHWVSPLGANLYLSIDWHFAAGVAALQGLPLAVGVAIVDALEALGARELRLKWPNDLLCRGAKLGGILLESGSTVEGGCRVVVGVGINVVMPAAQAAGVGQPWTDLCQVLDAAPLRRDLLAAALLDRLLPLLADFSHSGFAGWRERWQALDAYAGQRVVVSSGEQRIAGVARGVDACGALLLETATGVQTLHGGELSLRPAA
jgi:BirA family biotin operon repressor/biotin-[acetyl-CoA-carboxylase] ligase